MSLVNVLSWIAMFVTILFFSTGFLTCRKIIRNNSTENVSHLPFLVTAFSCFMWIMYGISAKNSTIIIVNTIGMTLQCFYLLCHFVYSKMEPVFRHTVFIVIFTCSLMSYFKYYVSDEKELVQQMGLLCVVITIVMFGTPLVELAKIVKSKSTESLSFPLCVMTILNSSLWTSYGYLIADRFVIVPNLLGMLLGVVQVALFVIFPSESRPVISM